MTQDVTLKVVKATLVTYNHLDTLYLEIEAPTTFPEIGGPPQVQIQAREGYGAEWCRQVLKLDPEVIDVAALQKRNEPDAITTTLWEGMDFDDLLEMGRKVRVPAERLKDVPDGEYLREIEGKTYRLKIATVRMMPEPNREPIRVAVVSLVTPQIPEEEGDLEKRVYEIVSRHTQEGTRVAIPISVPPKEIVDIPDGDHDCEMPSGRLYKLFVSPHFEGKVLKRKAIITRP